MQMGGISGITYQFDWSELHGSWAYEAKTQEEIDDIIAVNFLPAFPWRFSFIMPDLAVVGSGPTADGEAPALAYRAVASIPPWVSPSKYANYPCPDLVELAKNCGFSPKGSHNDTASLLAQLDSYMIGRAFAMEEVRRVHKELESMKAALGAGVPALPPAEKPLEVVAKTENAVVVKEPIPALTHSAPAPAVKRGRGRPAKVHPQPRRLNLATA
jgi:hypothetical protein